MTNETAAKESLLRRQLNEQARAKMTNEKVAELEAIIGGGTASLSMEESQQLRVIWNSWLHDAALLYTHQQDRHEHAALRAPNPSMACGGGYDLSDGKWMCPDCGAESKEQCTLRSPQTNPEAQADASEGQSVRTEAAERSTRKPAAAGPSPEEVREAALAACTLIASTGGSAMHCVEAIRALPLEGK